jgi:hypothetical protein
LSIKIKHLKRVFKWRLIVYEEKWNSKVDSIRNEEISRNVTPVFSKENQVHNYMHARINFMHIVTNKCLQKQYHVKKEKDYQKFTLCPGNEGSKHHRQSTGGCVCLELHNIFTAPSSFCATLFIARIYENLS